MSELDMLKKYQDIIDRDHGLVEDELDEGQIDEARAVHTMDLLAQITDLPMIEKRVDMWSQADGTAGLFRSTDGQAYEIMVRPAKLAKHPNLKQRTLGRKKR